MENETSHAFSTERERNKITLEYTWNTADLYQSDDAWAEAKARLVGEIPSLTAYRGTLSSSAGTLLACLAMIS